jgi:uncharacterized membrane protein YgdD (TMEM256/DUF423 family)
MTTKQMLLSGAIFSMLAVMIGAFGAHALHSTLIANGRLATFETAVQYQIFHALALLFLGLFEANFPSKTNRIAALFFFFGILIFSGSLYILAIFNIPILGAVTPFGGVAFIIGWILVIVSIVKMKLN